MTNITDEWDKRISKFLVGKVIKESRYLSGEEMKDMGGGYWDKTPIIIIFTDGSWILPMQDDEGNDGGAMCTSDQKNLPTIPVC